MSKEAKKSEKATSETSSEGGDMVLVLSLDGGGFRGAIITAFLSRLEEEIDVPLHEMFDMYVGTSVGGLLVSGLCHKKFTARHMRDKIFTHKIGKKMMRKSLLDKVVDTVQPCPKYDGRGKREVIKSIVGENTGFHMSDKPVCVTAYDITKQKPVYIKSWKDGDRYTIANALDVTSAAPAYYPSVEFRRGHWGIDGGVHTVNPAMVAYIEAIKMYGEEKDIRVLSIGTGYDRKHPMGEETEKWGGLQWMTKGGIIGMLMDAPMQNTTYFVDKMAEALGHQHVRVQHDGVEFDLDDVRESTLEELKKIGYALWEHHKEEVLDLLLLQEVESDEEDEDEDDEESE